MSLVFLSSPPGVPLLECTMRRAALLPLKSVREIPQERDWSRSVTSQEEEGGGLDSYSMHTVEGTRAHAVKLEHTTQT